MREKILAAIQAKFPKVNLSKARKTQIAAFIEKKVIDDETKVDAALDEFNEFNPIVELAKQDDRIRDLESKVKPPAPAPTDPTKTDDPPAPFQLPDDADPIVKAMYELNKNLLAKVDTMGQSLAALQTEKTATSIREKVAASMKEKGIPDIIWAFSAMPDKVEDIEGFVEKVNTGFVEANKINVESGLAAIGAPKGGNGGPSKGPVKKETDKDIVDLAERLVG